MIAATLAAFLIINAVVLKIYTETVEKEWTSFVQNSLEENRGEDLLAALTPHRERLLILLAADGVLCVLSFVVISRIFAGRLSDSIREPLSVLAEGAARIRRGELEQEAQYSGMTEFESVCRAFNEMQRHILEEQEKNRRYERARTEMIAGISHDLRTPLTAIRGTLKGLIDGIVSSPEQRDRFLRTAYRRSGEMEGLLNQLFFLSKLETGNMPLSLRSVVLSELILDYTEENRAAAEQEGILLTAQIQEQVRSSRAGIDPEQFRRVLDNLLENSRKYGVKRPLHVVIGLGRDPDGLCVAFSDDGEGVDSGKLPHLFEEFYRADESRNRKEGSGLGLYIVRRLTEAMGGSVRAQSGDGFTVLLKLPVKE